MAGQYNYNEAYAQYVRQQRPPPPQQQQEQRGPAPPYNAGHGYPPQTGGPMYQQPPPPPAAPYGAGPPHPGPTGAMYPPQPPAPLGHYHSNANNGWGYEAPTKPQQYAPHPPAPAPYPNPQYAPAPYPNAQYAPAPAPPAPVNAWGGPPSGPGNGQGGRWENTLSYIATGGSNERQPYPGALHPASSGGGRRQFATPTANSNSGPGSSGYAAPATNDYGNRPSSTMGAPTPAPAMQQPHQAQSTNARPGGPSGDNSMGSIYCPPAQGNAWQAANVARQQQQQHQQQRGAGMGAPAGYPQQRAGGMSTTAGAVDDQHTLHPPKKTDAAAPQTTTAASKAATGTKATDTAASRKEQLKNLYARKNSNPSKGKANAALKKAASMATGKPAVDTTSMEYLRSLLAKQRTAKGPKPQRKRSAAAAISPKEIVVPANFSPSHAYRAAAAHALLRTLSIELRLSPFPLQAFLTALMLPVPSRLLGEIHVRVLRLLYADAGMGSYAKYGEGTLSKIARRKRKTKDGSVGGKDAFDAEVANRAVLVTKRGGDNLHFLDAITWPLFYEDYAQATADKFLDGMGLLDDGDDNANDDEFISLKSPAMLPMEEIDLDPEDGPQSFSGNDVPRAGYVNRCPAGPLGHRNAAGRFVCCPFHIATAVQMFRRRNPAAAGKYTTKPPGKKRGRPPKNKGGRPPAKGKGGRRKSRASKSSYGGSSSSDSEFSDEDSDDADFPSPSKKRARNEMSAAALPQPSPSSGIRGSRVSNVEYASPNRAGDVVSSRPPVVIGAAAVVPKTAPSRVNGGLMAGKEMAAQSVQSNTGPTGVVDLTQPTKVVDLTKPIPAKNGSQQPPGSEGDGSEGDIAPNLVQQVVSKGSMQPPNATKPKYDPTRPPPQCQGSIPATTTQPQQPSSVISAPVQPVQPILVPPILLPPADEDALPVSDEVDKALGRFFLGAATSKLNRPVDDAADDATSSSSPVTDTQSSSVEESELLAHMAPIQQLEKGVPYHHLGLEAKLTMLEFLLDELLQVEEIGHVMTRRHVHTDALSYPYGKIPLPQEYEDMYNADECTICGIEGDLLCCDGCPGSFHRQCIGMARQGKLPEGKWLCPECKVVDASKMGPLGLEGRPLIGWFTLGDLETELSQVLERPSEQNAGQATNQVGLAGAGGISGAPSGIMALAPNPNPNVQAFAHPANSGMVIAPPPNSIVPSAVHTPIMAATANNNASGYPPNAMMASVAAAGYHVPILPESPFELLKKCKIPEEVEFLVTSTQIFARYRSSLEPFDPLNPMRLSNETFVKSGLKSPSPPVPLTARQLEGLLKLLGPTLCLALPWNRIPFTPERVFAALKDAAKSSMGGTTLTGLFAPNNRNREADHLRSLVTHQTKSRNLLRNHPEQNNPMVYSNSYRRAPPVPMVKVQQGQFFILSNSDIYHYPTKTSTLSIALTDLTIHRGLDMHTAYVDPFKSIRDKMISMERSLYNACLLDFRWGLNEYGDNCWKKKVEHANSVKVLASLLISLIDACSLKVFVPEWYKPKVDSDGGAGGRASRAANDPKESSIAVSEEWKPEQESSRRKWERCKGNEIMRLFDGLEVVFNRGASGKRKKRMARIDAIDINLEGEGAGSSKDNAPKRNLSAYMHYSNAIRNDVKTAHPNATFGEVLKIIARQWKQMTPEERAPWDKRADTDKERYQKEMMEYSGSNKDGDHVGSSNDNAPKKGLSAWNMYSNAIRNDVKMAYPNVAPAEVMKIIAKQWKQMTPEDRAPWDQKAAADKERYQKEMAEYSTSLAPSQQDENTQAASSTAAKEQTTNEKDCAVLNERTARGSDDSIQVSSNNQNDAPASKATLAKELTETKDESPRSVAPTPQPPKSSNGDLPMDTNATLSPSKKRRSCGKCEVCLQEDCRECVNCLDMKKFGGPDKLRQKCVMRKKCPLVEVATPAKSKPPAESKKSSQKKRKKRDSYAPSSSRRRSDRLGIMRGQLETLLGITDAENNNVEEAIVELKLDKLEKLLSTDVTSTAYWAIAGKKLFEPDGEVSRPTVKRLARTAGSVRAPSISYDTSYEVGELSTCHHWRKRTMSCTSFEGLFYSLSFLDAHINSAIAVSAVNIASRKANAKKSSTMGAIRCVHTDPLTGFNEYFVLPSGKKRGCWYPEESVDLSSFIHYRFERRRPYVERKERKERGRKMKEAVEKAQAAAGSKRKAPGSSAKKPRAKKPKTDVFMKQFNDAVDKHRNDTVRLLTNAALLGQSTVPPQEMAGCRHKNLSTMRTVSLQLHQAGGRKLTEHDFTARMAKAEGEAVQRYIANMQRAKALGPGHAK